MQPQAASQQETTEEVIAKVDKILKFAEDDWKANNYESALGKAKMALDICNTKLGPNHPKTAQVKAMCDAAQQQMNKQ